MNKAEIIAAMAEKAGLTQKDCGKALDAFVATVIDGAKADDKITLVGFGTFEVRNRKARQGRNPSNNEVIQIPASKVPAFKAGKAFKDAVK